MHIAFLLFTILVAVVGQICIKSAVLNIGVLEFSGPGQVLQSTVTLLSQPLIWVALALYGVGFVLWSFALQRLALSYAYPMLAASFLLVPVAGHLLFGEQLSMARVAGIALIVVGVVLVGRG